MTGFPDEMRTARLMLRRARADDADAMHEILSDARAMRHWSTPPHERIGQTRDWLATMTGADPAGSDDFIIELDGAPIGKAGCWRVPEVGFILHPRHWGQGLAREALEAVISRVFARFPIPRIEADVDPRNAASLHLLARLGFRHVGAASRTWKVGEEWCDSVYLALDRPGTLTPATG